MSVTVFRLCPVGGYDIPALEIWLENGRQGSGV